MIFDAIGPYFQNSYNYNLEKPQNKNANFLFLFFDMLHVTQSPLWMGCNSITKLFIAIRMLSIKFYYNLPKGNFDEIMKLLKETNLEGVLYRETHTRSKSQF